MQLSSELNWMYWYILTNSINLVGMGRGGGGGGGGGEGEGEREGLTNIYSLLTHD